MPGYLPELIAQCVAFAVSIFSLKKRSVTVSGFMSMLVISSVFIWNNGIAPLIILFSMFASASILTKYKQVLKSKLTEGILKKSGPRDFVQAFSNLGVAFFCFLFYLWFAQTEFLLAMIGSVAASNADSWASEIGVLSKKKPVMITTFKPCIPGISGGITFSGTLAGILGSTFIAGIAVLLKEYMNIEISSLYLFITISIGGTIGLLIDSYLGATLQVRYKDPSGRETEDPSNSATKIHGWKGINNDMVNFLSSLTAALITLLMVFRP